MDPDDDDAALQLTLHFSHETMREDDEFRMALEMSARV